TGGFLMTQVLPPEEPAGLSMRQLTHIIYGLITLSILSGGLFGLASVAAVALAYLKRGDAAGTVYASHFDWAIRTFWWGLLWLVLSGLATFIFIGWITGIVALVWIIYRVIKGWLALLANQAPVAEF